jgi:hypothetical protein
MGGGRKGPAGAVKLRKGTVTVSRNGQTETVEVVANQQGFEVIGHLMDDLGVLQDELDELSCERVLVEANGLAISPRRARKEHGKCAEVIFYRDDGWRLGAPAALEAEARKLWADNWVFVARAPSWRPHKIEEDDRAHGEHTSN